MADSTYFDRGLETRPWADVSAAAFAKAQRQFERVYDVSPFYRRKYTEAGVDPALIDSPADFAKLPFLTKD
ncbi:MAG TPA: phenylacetate--CoA ligase, partial [Actinomycetota bacterium]|nr:phenylacetate--CoA ligase [Actinomycetota bacterium]